MSSPSPAPLPAPGEMVQLKWQGGVVIASLAVSLIVMGFEWVGPDFVFALLATLYMITGIVSIRDGAAGFSNSGVLTVLALYVVAEGVSQTGALDVAMNYVLGRASNVFFAQVRMMIPVMIASAFLNNTPIVALMIPVLISWAKRCGVPAKKLLIPLSYATVLGGTVTIIGTSTNLVVSGLQEERYRSMGDTGKQYIFGFFDLAPYGIPYAIWGMAYIVLFSKWLLPGNDDDASRQDLVSGLYVPASSPVVGSDVKQSGVLVGGQLVLQAVAPQGKTALPAPIEYVVQAGDTLYVTGAVRTVETAAKNFGLVLVTDETDSRDAQIAVSVMEEGFDAVEARGPTSLVQVTLKKGSDLVKKTIKEAGFRGRFNAAVIAVKRHRKVQQGRLGDITLQPRDVIVLSVNDKFDHSTAEFAKNFERLVYLEEALAKEFSCAMRVTQGSRIAKQSIQAAGLRGITGLYLYEVIRADGTQLPAVSHDTILEEGDTLYFTGDLEAVGFLNKFPGLEHQQARQIAALETDIIHRRLAQAVVSTHSPLLHKTLKEVQFRKTFGAAVIAIHRAGHAVNTDLSGTPLQAGDVLVLEAGPEFASSFSQNKAFALINEVPNSSPVKKSKMWIALGLTTLMVVTQIVGGAMNQDYIHLWPAAMLTSALMLAFKCLNGDQARSSIDWGVYICIAFAFAVSTALEKTKVALAIAQVFVKISNAIGGQTAALSCIYLVTALMSEVLTNNAAAAIMYPIAANLADQLGIHPNIMSVAVMLGGSAGWIMPYSYQCNLMVYAAGKYETKDFIKIGTPYYPWLLVGTIAIFALADRPYIMIVVSGIFTALVILIPAIWEFCLPARAKASITQKLDNLPVIGSKKSSSGGVEKSKHSGSGSVELNGKGGSGDRQDGKDVDSSDVQTPRRRFGF